MDNTNKNYNLHVVIIIRKIYNPENFSRLLIKLLPKSDQMLIYNPSVSWDKLFKYKIILHVLHFFCIFRSRGTDPVAANEDDKTSLDLTFR